MNYDIPSDLLPPTCDLAFAQMRLKQKQSFVSRFFTSRSSNTKHDEINTLRSARGVRALSSTSSKSYIATESASSSTTSMHLPMASRRHRSNTARSDTSVSSFVSQYSSDHILSSANRSSSRSSSQSSFERRSLLDGWTSVPQYF